MQVGQYQASRDEDLGVLWSGVLADPVRSEEKGHEHEVEGYSAGGTLGGR